MDISILVRCSDDWRVLACLDSIDVHCDVVVSLTPNPELEQAVRKRDVRYTMSPKGNPAATTLAALPLLRYSKVLLIDSDCTFFPGAIDRVYNLSKMYDIVRPNIHFDSCCFSSSLSALARRFQYTYCNFIYEPGLLINLNTVIPFVGGYLFSKYAPFTPDGELDYRIRQSITRTPFRIVDDSAITLRHAALTYRRHLYSYYRYGQSEATRMLILRQNVLFTFICGLGLRYGNLLSGKYPALTVPAILGSDIVYVVSMLWHLTAHQFLRRR